MALHFGHLDYWLSEDADDRLIATAVQLLEEAHPDTDRDDRQED